MTSIIAFVVVLGVLIFVHELGHFLAAKASGIAVPRFSIGLGPKVWGFTIGETEYVISALPLGGYVKMAGMGEEEALEKLEGGKVDLQVPPERRFESKPVFTRAVVISAGVIMNFIFAVIAYAALAYFASVAPLIGSVQDGLPAAEAGMRAGDLVRAVDGSEIDLWIEFRDYISERPGETVNVLVERGREEVELAIQVAAVDTTIEFDGRDTTVSFGRVGVMVDTLTTLHAFGAGESLVVGARQTYGVTSLVLGFIGQLFTGRASPRDLGGPILIGQYSGQFARMGPAAFLTFMAFLSVNLAVLNLLPIPILDGGHLVFLLVEAVRGRAVSVEMRARLSQLGFILILALMVWVITSDVLRLIGR